MWLLAALFPWLLPAAALEPAAPALLLSRVAWAPYTMPSTSIQPTLLAGDYLVVRTLGTEVRRGDVIVFRHPVTDVPFVKRVVGMAGDRVQMDAGRLHLNGESVPTEPAGTFEQPFAPQGLYAALPACRMAEPRPALGGPCRADRLVETLPGGTPHAVLDLGPTPQDDTETFVVPEGHLFVLGDNRDNSTDSRFDPATERGLGFVPEANVIGRVVLVAVSSASPDLANPLRWRANRLLRRVE